MNRFALIGFFRSLTRHKLYAALNIGGLAVGIAVFLILGLYVRFETGYERWLPHSDQLYQVEEAVQGDDGHADNTPVVFWTDLHQEQPNVPGTRVETVNATVVRGGIGVKQRVGLVDPDFFQVFALQGVAGDPAASLDDPGKVVLTEKTARQFFGSASPIGQTLTIGWRGDRHVLTVGAVIADLPANTDLDFGMLTKLTITQDPKNPYYASDHQWNYGNPITYVRLPNRAAAEAFAASANDLSRRRAASETPDNNAYAVTMSLKPLPDVHFEKPGSKLTVTTLGIVGLLTLVIAVVNYINLATARAGLRAREVAMRKVLGADRATLARHYVGEAIATAAIAGFIGLVLAEVGLPLVDAAAGLPLGITYFGAHGVLLPLILLVLLVGVLAGLYPALLLSRFPAAAVLASARSPGGGRSGTRIREALVVLQFSIAIAFIIGTLVLVAQTAHVRDADVGYDRANLLLVRSLGDDALTDGQRRTIVHGLAALPNAEAVSIGNDVPGGGFFTSSTNYNLPGVAGPGPSIDRAEATPGFFDVVGARLIAGRLFDPSRPGDVDANFADPDPNPKAQVPSNVVLNETAVRALHLGSAQAAIGKTFGASAGQPRTVIGVIADMRFGSARETVPAELFDFTLSPPDSPIAIVRFRGDPKAMLDAARSAWLRAAPEVPFDAATATERLQKFYASDDHAANLFTIGAVLAVLIGCVGLWGLASFNTARRIKEIGIRKTLGASSADIVTLLVGQFLRPVVIANLFAWPLAWFAMRTWLAGFDDRIALSPLFFIAATVLALAIAVATVIAQSLRAAHAAPAWALRHE